MIRSPRASGAFGAGVDTLFGTDNLVGTVHADTLTGHSLANTIWAGAGNDTLWGMEDNDVLRGEAGNDTLQGGDGNDSLWGGAGLDRSTGGQGGDWFRFASSTDTGTTLATADRILDFNASHGDRIDLVGIDARTNQAGEQAFAFIGTAAFTAAGQIRQQRDGSDLRVELNLDADATSEALLLLIGRSSVSATDFVL